MKTRARLPQLSFWGWIFLLLMLGGFYATYVRIGRGLGAATRLSDSFPWGLSVGLNVLCGLALAAGGFTLAAIIHLFDLERYKPLLRSLTLTAFLGYLVAILTLFFDLGRPSLVWHLMLTWKPQSVLFGQAWCLMLYLLVLVLEFAPMAFERFGWHAPPRWLRFTSIPVVLSAAVLSVLQQSTLASLLAIAPRKPSSFWSTPLLPVLFLLSGMVGCLALVIFASWHSSRAFGKQLELPVLANVERVLSVLLFLYVLLFAFDVDLRTSPPDLLAKQVETALLGLEISLFLLPTLFLFRAYVRTHPDRIYVCTVLVIAGFMTNRLNVSITSIETSLGIRYLPGWTEILFTYSVLALAFVVFRFAAKHLPVFAEVKPTPPLVALAGLSATRA